ncbi:MAG: hypothetical protein R3E00_09400 [Paracoccaceae bacterium]
MGQWIHDGRLEERDFDVLTPDEIRKRISEKNLAPNGRRVAVQMGAELRPIDQLKGDKAFTQETVKTKSFPSGTIKGLENR